MECPVCSFICESVDSFLVHVKSHFCSYCPVQYHCLPNHNFACQSAEEIHSSCSLCGALFQRISELIVHYGDHRCVICNKFECTCSSIRQYIQTGDGLVVDEQVPTSSASNVTSLVRSDTSAAAVHLDKGSHNQSTVGKRATKEVSDAYRAMQKRFCNKCSIRFKNIEELQQHLYRIHKEEITSELVNLVQETDPMNIKFTRDVLDESYIIYEADLFDVDVFDIDGLFFALKDKVFSTLSAILKERKIFKIQFDLDMQFLKEDGDLVSHRFVPIESFVFSVFNEFELMHVYNTVREQYNVRVENYEENGSGLVLERINKFKFNVMDIGTLIGGSSRTVLPEVLKLKYRTLLNVPGDEGLCFKRAILAHNDIKGYLAKGPHRKRILQSEGFYRSLLDDPIVNWNGINFPFCISQVDTFHKNNKDIGLFIFIYDENPADVDIEKNTSTEDMPKQDSVRHSLPPTSTPGKKRRMEIFRTIRQHIYPLSIIKEQRNIKIDLLLVMNGIQGHYCLITNLVGFLKNPQRRDVKCICRFCLQSFGVDYDSHVENCAALDRQKVNFPTDDYLRFTKHKNRILAPYFGTADFESLLLKLNESSGETILLQKHKPSTYSFAIADWKGDLVTSECYIADSDNINVAERMIAQLLALAEKLNDNIDNFEEEAYAIAPEILRDVPIPREPVKCKWCSRTTQPGKIHRHHSHLPPYNFVGYLCSNCNVNGQVSRILNIFVHNLKGYDGHFILRAASNKALVDDVQIIAQSSEKITAIRLNNKVQFLDSLNHFNASLDSICQTMNTEKDFNVTRKYFLDKYKEEAKVKLLLQKGFFPYTHIDSLERFNETQLPGKDAFFNDLTQQPIKAADYEHAQKLWKELDVKNLREYTEIYALTDTLILMDAMIKMRKMFLKDFLIDPIHYFSISQLSFDCCLSYTGISLQIVKDPDLSLYFRTSLRGGLSTGGSIKHATANNKYLPSHDATKDSTFICYFDLNNLYPFALSNNIPYDDIHFVTGKEYEQILRCGEDFIMSIPDDGPIGYHFEVTLFFPKEVHDYFAQFPPAPYRRSIKYDELSPSQHKKAVDLGIKEARMTAPKLVADLKDRNLYKLDCRTLKYYLSIGVRLAYIHRVVKFLQKPFLKPYFDLLAEKRKNAASQLEQNTFKLLGNAIYGKCGERKELRTNFKIIRSRDEAVKYNRKPTVSRIIILEKNEGEDDMVMVALKRLEVTLDRPIYVAATCLDLAKLVHYKWFYNFALPKWNKPGKPVQLIAVDTDSYFLHLHSEDVFQDMKDHPEEFDCSNFDPQHPIFGKFHSDENKKRLGWMKNEEVNGCISEMIFLRPKQYMYRVQCIDGVDRISGQRSFLQRDVKKGKGIDRVALEKECLYEHYKDSLVSNVQYTNTSMKIISKKHQVFTVQQRKRGLMSLDSKSYQEDATNCIPFGHYKLRKKSEESTTQDRCRCPYCDL